MKNQNIFKNICLVLIFSLVTYSLNAQDSKDVSITNFNRVSVSNGIDLYLTQSNSENIKINAHPDLIKNVIIEKEGNNLRVRYKDQISWSRLFKGQTIKVYINYKTLQEIAASGGSDVYTQNTLRTSRLTLQASGGSDLKINVSTKELQVHTSGGSDIHLKGNAANMETQSSGGSDIDALELETDYAKINASGGSDVNINVTKALEVNASGGSDIHYKGNAAVKNSSGKNSDVIKIN